MGYMGSKMHNPPLVGKSLKLSFIYHREHLLRHGQGEVSQNPPVDFDGDLPLGQLCHILKVFLRLIEEYIILPWRPPHPTRHPQPQTHRASAYRAPD